MKVKKQYLFWAKVNAKIGNKTPREREREREMGMRVENVRWKKGEEKKEKLGILICDIICFAHK